MMGSIEELTPFDIDRSNRGASKQRRDQINTEISIIRDLLPLPESSRQRLSQLQIMSLTCVYIRKCNALQKLFQITSREPELPGSLGFFHAMTEFLLVTTREGKLLYISENVTDYLGHSMVDMKSQGDSLYDLVDKRDHGTVRTHLSQGWTKEGQESFDDISFFCRMNMSRTLKRHAGFGDVKVMHVRGHFKNTNSEEPGCSSEKPCVFIATCSPMISPDMKENLVQNNTMVFKTVHKLDMTFLGISKNGEYHLGCTNENLSQKSWYSFLHPLDIIEAKVKHSQLIGSNHETNCMMTVRMIRLDGISFWVNIVMNLHQSYMSQSEEPLIICMNQVIGAHEACQMKDQGHMFSTYSNSVQDLNGGHLAAACSPIENKISDLWHLHVSNATTVSEYQANIPSYIETTERPEILLNKSSTLGSSNTKPEVNCILQNSFVQLHQLKTLLKRKIHKKQPKSCTPAKLSRLSWDNDNFSREIDNSINGHMIVHSEQYTQTSSSSYPDFHRQEMQVLYQNTAGIMENVEMLLKQPTFQGLPKESYKTSEQIVPESYLTPDPSPISSPQSCHLSEETKILGSKEDVSHEKPVSILKALEKLAALPHGSKNEKGPDFKEKELPVLDASYIENFFDELTEKLELSTSVKFEDIIKHEIKTKVPLDQASPLNIPNFVALKDEICVSPYFSYSNLNDVHSNIKLSSQMQHSSQSQAPKHQLQFSTQSPQTQPQLQHLSQLQIQSQLQHLSQPRNQPQVQHLFHSQVQPKMQLSSTPPEIQFQKHPSFYPQVQAQQSPTLQPQIHIRPAIPDSYSSTLHEVPVKSFPHVDTNASELCSNLYEYQNEVLESSALVSSPESIASQEAIDDFLSCLSNDGCDEMQLKPMSSTSEDILDTHSEISFYMEDSDIIKLTKIGPKDMLELLSPQSNISSLEDDLFDNSKFAFNKTLNEITAPDHLLVQSNSDTKDQNMSSDHEWNFILNSWMLPQGFPDLNVIKNSQ